MYDKVARAQPVPLLQRLQKTFSRGPVFGPSSILDNNPF